MDIRHTSNICATLELVVLHLHFIERMMSMLHAEWPLIEAVTMQFVYAPLVWVCMARAEAVFSIPR